MKRQFQILAAFLFLLCGIASHGQTLDKKDKTLLQNHIEAAKQQMDDSIKKAEIELQLAKLKTAQYLQLEELQKQLRTIEEKEQKRISDKKAHIDSLRQKVKGYPVVGQMKDTLFLIYSKIGASTPAERAANISRKIKKLCEDDFLKADSIRVIKSENTYDIMYGELIIMSISENDALWQGKSSAELAEQFKTILISSINAAQKENSLSGIAFRISMVLLVVVIGWLIFWLINKVYNRLMGFISSKREAWLKNLTYKDYTFLTAEQEMQIILFLAKLLRWFVNAVLLYLSLLLVFSIFPFSRNWAGTLFHLIWSPFKGIFVAVWHYFPNLFSILVIYTVMKYVIRFSKYIFHEIQTEKLKISGFHADWAEPTYSIVKFLLYAFMFVIIFPYLPGSDSTIFKGVSVFLGILFSLGSSSAIANAVAGLIITYMRPFKIGDRIKIGEVTGDVVEKTLLVTRIRSIKNELITIPNSSVLTGNTTNYSSEAAEKGLIIFTTVTIGYDVPWKDMHKALIDAALRTKHILEEPQPFVLQTSLEDFYVSYQINAHTREASMQAIIYSELHQNIQDVCNERGIEILSPHYRAARDGNPTTIPANYLPGDYKAPGFKVNIEKD